MVSGGWRALRWVLKIQQFQQYAILCYILLLKHISGVFGKGRNLVFMK